MCDLLSHVMIHWSMLYYVQSPTLGMHLYLFIFNSGIYPDLMLDDIVGLSSYSVLGKRLGKHMGIVAKEVKAMSQESILAFEKSGEVTLSGHCLKLTDIKVLILLANIIHFSRGSL